MNNNQEQQLKKLSKNEKALENLIENIIFLENQLNELKKHPFIEVSSKNPAKTRVTPVAKLYKEFMIQYISAMKVLLTVNRTTSSEGESPLRQWVLQRLGDAQDD